MSSGCIVRPAVLDDAAAVSALLRDAFEGYRPLYTPEAFAASHGHDRLVLSTTPFLDSAIRLYERAGFRRSAAGPRDLAGTPLFTMEKGLTASS